MTDLDIVVTDHAAARWDARTDPSSVAPETAWKEGYPFALTDPEFHRIDEARVHRPTATVIFRMQTSVVTVWSLRTEDVTTARGQLVADAATAQFGAVGGGSA